MLGKDQASLLAGALIPAIDADVPEIVTLMNRAYRSTDHPSGWHTESGYITGDRTTQALLRSDMAEKPEASFLTWRDRHTGALTGCVWVEPLGDDLWYLGSLAVDPHRQNAGLGHALLAAAESWLLDRSARRIRISVVNIRRVLIAWYNRRGYRETGETSPFPYGDNRFGIPQRDDLCFTILEKELTAEA